MFVNNCLKLYSTKTHSFHYCLATYFSHTLIPPLIAASSNHYFTFRQFFLVTTYKNNHAVCLFLYLAKWNNDIRAIASSSIHFAVVTGFSSVYGWMIVHGANISHLLLAVETNDGANICNMSFIYWFYFLWMYTYNWDSWII